MRGLIMTMFWLGFSLGAHAEDPKALATQVKQLFEARCYKCHGQPGERVRGDFGFILDFARLRASDYLNLTSPENSKLYDLVRAGEMPYRETPLAATELQLVLDWIRAGAPDYGSNTPIEGEFVTEEEGARLIIQDLLGFDLSQRRSLRYFSFLHFVRRGVKAEELDSSIAALTKILNSLSWRSNLVKPKVIDERRALVRLDLKELGWGDGQWEELLRANPYAVLRAGEEFAQLETLTTSRLPVMRGDWFVAAASRPPLYHSLLQLPNTAQELERLLGVDVSGNIDHAVAARAGFRGGLFSDGSGVSYNNRMIERHPTAYGAYWKSYDFKGNIGREDLFSFPLGPGSGARDFQHAGGEIIFNLPNGLQGYLLVNNAGKRLDTAPIEIVHDSTTSDGVITNGISCMSCHSKGMRDHDDQIRDFVHAHMRNFPSDVPRMVDRLYPPIPQFRALIEKDRDRFVAALGRIGIVPTGPVEPVRVLSERFDQTVNLKQAAAELGLKEADFARQIDTNVALQPLGAQLRGPGITRAQFVDVFAELFLELGLGQVYSTVPVLRSSVADEDLARAAERCDLLGARAALRRGASGVAVRALEQALSARCEAVALEVLPAYQAADLNAGYGEFPSSVHLAIVSQAEDVLRDMITRPGIDLRIRNRNGLTPLALAISLGETGAFKILIEQKPTVLSSINLADTKGFRPLHWAALVPMAEGARGLALTAGVEINARDMAGKTPMAYARQLSRESPGQPDFARVVEILRLAGGTN